jgi:hypothetical protein
MTRKKSLVSEIGAPQGTQLDVFGVVGAELDRREAIAAAGIELARRACTSPDGAPVMWVAPYDCPAAKKGQAVPGWRCWLCGQTEVNEYVLNLNHGLTAVYPESLDRTECTRQILLASQARAEAERQAHNADGAVRDARVAKAPPVPPVRRRTSKRTTTRA